ncbi:MAG: hypothetical protein ABR497_11350, partial [Kiritimatiellia bacterium]
MCYFPFIVFTVLLINVVAGPPAAAMDKHKPPVDVGSRLELFVDDFLIDGLSGAAVRQLHHP